MAVSLWVRSSVTTSPLLPRTVSRTSTEEFFPIFDVLAWVNEDPLFAPATRRASLKASMFS